MLTILNDPAGITGRTQHSFDYEITLQQNIALHLDGGGDCELLINGLKVDPLTDHRMDQLPSSFDIATVIQRPAGLEILGYAWYYWAAGAVAIAAATYALMPKIDGASMGNVGKDSPNNRLTAQSNQARAYQAIPDCYGYRRVWPDMIQPSTVEYIDHIKYVTEWLCISRGVGDVTDVQYAETPILDIAGASFELFEPVGASAYPENNSTTLTDVLETFASDETNGQELEYSAVYPIVTATGSFSAVITETTFTVTIPDGPTLDNLKSLAPSGTATVVFVYTDSLAAPQTFSQTCTVQSYSVLAGNATFVFTSTAWVETDSESGVSFTITPNGTSYITQGPYTLPIDCERLRWNTVFLRGLKGSVSIKAEWWQVDGSGVEIAGTRQNQTDAYAADTFDQRFYTTQVTPTAGTGRYRIQFTRLTAQIGDGGSDVAKLEEVYAVRYYATKVLPGVTAIRVTTMATEQATGYSERKFNLRFSRHVRTLTTDTLSASRNFARVMAHIWTLSGNAMTGLDTFALAAVNAEFGETSELLRFDASLDDADMSLGERLQTVANHARCIVWRDGQKWTITRDQAKAYPEMQFDYRNLASDGDSAISYASHLPASNDGVEIEYVDALSQSKKAYVRLNISTGAPVVGVSNNAKKIQLMGCTSTVQATNRAYLEANRLIYQRTSVSDKCLSDGGSLGLGSLVKWIDPNDFAGDDGLQAGEVLSIASDIITTSEPLDWQGATSGRILFTGVDGLHLGAPIVCYPSGSSVQLASVPAGLYIADATRQLGSRYAFAIGLTAAEVESAGLYTATSIKPAGDGTSSLALAFYDARIYSQD